VFGDCSGAAFKQTRNVVGWLKLIPIAASAKGTLILMYIKMLQKVNCLAVQMKKKRNKILRRQ